MIGPAIALIGLRAVIFTAAAILFGSALLLLLNRTELAVTLRNRLRPVLKIAAAVLAIGTPLMLIVLASIAGEGWQDGFDPAILKSLALETRGGQAIVLRIALAAVIACLTWTEDHEHGVADPRLAVASGLYVASFALTGHAAMHEGLTGVLHPLNHALHVLTGSFWIGALVPLLLAAHMAANASDRLRQQALTLLTSFSFAGTMAVTLIAITGALNTYFILGKLPDMAASTYQRLLLTKIAVIGVMLSLAIANRFWLVPRMTSARGQGPLAASIATECIAGIIVIALVAAFGTMEPV